MTLETLKDFVLWLCEWAFVLMIGALAYNISPLGRDNSDEPGWFGMRSGVEIVKDHLTGCEYLKTAGGGLTPRVGIDGKQVGCSSDNPMIGEQK